MVTTAVEQLTLVLKQATALGIKKQIITTGGSQNPDQLIDQAGVAANGLDAPHDVRALVSGRNAESRPRRSISLASGRSAALISPARPRASVVMTASAPSSPQSRRPERPSLKRSPSALWKTDLMGLNGKIKFEKQGPAGKESGQSMPNGLSDQDRQRRKLSLRRPEADCAGMAPATLASVSIDAGVVADGGRKLARLE